MYTLIFSLFFYQRWPGEQCIDTLLAGAALREGWLFDYLGHIMKEFYVQFGKDLVITL
jgi:hypothetical protein